MSWCATLIDHISPPSLHGAITHYATESRILRRDLRLRVKATIATLERDMHPTVRQIDGLPKVLRIKLP
jgi:hypothetical protein